MEDFIAFLLHLEAWAPIGFGLLSLGGITLLYVWVIIDFLNRIVELRMQSKDNTEYSLLPLLYTTLKPVLICFVLGYTSLIYASAFVTFVCGMITFGMIKVVRFALCSLPK